MPRSEKELIQQIRRSASVGKTTDKATEKTTGKAGGKLVKGIGDDCAVLRVPPGRELLVTTDFTIENVHFRREWHPPELVGWRCLTRGLSDIAAMGGEPLAAFLSLALARDVPSSWTNRFLKGLLELAGQFKVPLAGGDTAQSTGGIQADIVVIGSVPRGKAILRSGARAGDQIYVTGELGGAAFALAQLMQVQSKSPRGGLLQALRPNARLSVGQWLRRRGVASAMIDLSDGLSTDLEHICEESGVGAEIEAQAIPRAPAGLGKEAGKESRKELVPLKLALHGGDDYELLFTSAAKLPSAIAGVRVTRIGQITRSRGMRLREANGKTRSMKAEGWEHFRRHS